MAAPNLGQGIDRGNYRRRNGITPPAVQGKAAGAVAETVFFGTATASVTHATTGVLVADIGSIVGSAARAGGAVTHATTGALTGQGSTVAGTAARTRQFATNGALTGQGSTLAGSARHNIPHPATGTLTGPGSSLAGSAARTRAFATSGALTGQGSTLAGSAARTLLHATTGVLTADGAIIVGSAARAASAVTHDTSGALTGPGAIIVGDATLIDPPRGKGGGGGGAVAAKSRKRVRSTYVRNTAKENLYAVLSQLDTDRQAEVVELVAPLATLKQPEAQRIAATVQQRSTELESVRQLHADIARLEQQLKSKRDSEAEYATLRKMSLDLREMIMEEEEFIEAYSHVLAADSMALLSIVGVRV